MCRVLMYLGKPLLLDELLYQPDSSLIKQTYDPKFMSKVHNIAGFGMAAWESSSYHLAEPFIYKTIKPPFYDANLKHLAGKIKTNCLIAHVRGVPYSEKEVVAEQNVHPFKYEGFNISLAHNGNLMDFNSMKYSLLKFIKPEIACQIKGTTDSEWMYALFLSYLEDSKTRSVEKVSKALLKMLMTLSEVRKQHHIAVSSPVNLFISNGEFLVATRFIFDYGCYGKKYNDPHLSFNYNSLWYTYGKEYGLYEGEYKMKCGDKRSSMIVASEPLTMDTTTWVELPEYSMLMASIDNGEIKIKVQNIQI